MSNNETASQISNNTLLRTLLVGGTAAIVSLGLAACTGSSKTETTNEHIAAAKAMAGRYVCNVVSIHEGRSPLKAMSAYRADKIVVDLWNRENAKPYLDGDGLPKDPNILIPNSPQIRVIAHAKSGNGTAGKTELEWDVDDDPMGWPSHDDGTGLMPGLLHAARQAPGTVADIQLHTLVDVATDEGGHTYYGKIPCGTGVYNDQGELELHKSTERDGEPQITEIKP